MPLKTGDVVKIKPEYQDAGDHAITFIAIEDEDGGRVKIQAQLGLPINPTQVVYVEWLETDPCN
jgi:hypothetical protein